MKPVAAPDQPDGLILYDGECVFCSRWVQWVIVRDPDRRYRFVSVQSPLGRRIAQAVGIDPAAPQSNAVILGGTALFKSDAALNVLASLDGWGWTRPLLWTPRSLRDWGYDRIAANRYRIFGRTTVCWAPPPEERERFLS